MPAELDSVEDSGVRVRYLKGGSVTYGRPLTVQESAKLWADQSRPLFPGVSSHSPTIAELRAVQERLLKRARPGVGSVVDDLDAERVELEGLRSDWFRDAALATLPEGLRSHPGAVKLAQRTPTRRQLLQHAPHIQTPEARSHRVTTRTDRRCRSDALLCHSSTSLMQPLYHLRTRQDSDYILCDSELSSRLSPRR